MEDFLKAVKKKLFVMYGFLFLPYCSIGQEINIQYPFAYKSNVEDNYFGQPVRDPYRWMEDDTLQETKKWVAAENKLTEEYMQKLVVRYNIDAQLKQNSHYNFGTHLRSGKYYFDFLRSPYISSAGLYIKRKLNEKGEPLLIVNPDEYKKNKHDQVRIKDFEVSGDNKYLAFSLSFNGSDWNEIRVMTLYPFKKKEDVIVGVKFSTIRWKGEGFFYCRYESLQKDKPFTSVSVNPCVYYHKLGTLQERDSLIFEYKDTTTFQRLQFDVLENERFLVIYHNSVRSHIKYNQVSYYDYSDTLQKRLRPLILCPASQAFFYVVGFLNGEFVMQTNLDAPYQRIITVDPKKYNKANELIPEQDGVLEKVKLINHKIVCIYMKDIEYTTIVFDSTGKMLAKQNYPSGSSVSGLEETNQDSTTFFYFHSFLHPLVVFELNLSSLKTTLVEKTQINYDYEKLSMEKVFYKTKDGTVIPMIIACKKGLKRTSETPTVLYGYGGYGVSMTPFFNDGFITHILNGGIVAIACIRGGGEYGDEWHKQGMKENKQNVFDDFIAAAEYLIANNYTSSKRLALMGGSNGGLLVGVALTQRPDLFKVAICEVGVYDMLRYHHFTVGQAWINEYGVSSDSIAFNYLYKYSPLHNVKDSVDYPAVLIITGDHDDRVVPFHSYKFAATLQNKASGKSPVLLYAVKNAGHGAASKTTPYIYSFIYKNMGLKPSEVHSFY